ncbi:MAG: redoxin domain-containing protein [Parasporobacterium sp.]|nr:redoxin domain-containing protein [Parasporobacterium sp.]
MKKLIYLAAVLLMTALLSGTFVYAGEESADPASAAGDLSGAPGMELRKVDVPLSPEGEMTMADLSTLSISRKEIELSDEELNNILDNLRYVGSEEEQITEGILKEGDAVCIEYTTPLLEEPQIWMLLLGEHEFGEALDQALIGSEIGTSLDITCFFPDYVGEIGGQKTQVHVTALYKSETRLPEMNDEFAREYSSQYMDTQLDTVEELSAYIREEFGRQLKEGAIWSRLQSMQKIISYQETHFEVAKDFILQGLQMQVDSYQEMGTEGLTADYLAQVYGYATAEDYAAETALDYVKDLMLVDYLAEELHITCTQQDVEQAITENLLDDELNELTLEDYKEMNGGDWIYLYERLSVKYSRIMETLVQQVQVLDDTDAGDAGSNTVDAGGFPDLRQFTATTIDGEEFTQADLMQKDLTILNVWGTYCGPCLKEMPALAEFAASLPENVQLITYCVDAFYKAEEAGAILEENGLDAIVITGGDGDFSRLDAVLQYVPTTLFYNSHGEIAADTIIGSPTDLMDVYTQRMNSALGNK